jgi:Endoplasmic Reticulum-Golgi Intermediate Compartment (ERGIC)
MLVLFLSELQAFLRPEVYSTVMLDTNKDNKLRINFNITMLALPCEWASIDVLDVLGTNRVNVTKNIIKWHTDEFGNKAEFHGRNREQDDVRHDEHHRDIALAHEDGEHALPLTGAAWNDYVSGNEFVIADFYAPW